jgi:hypothetical protein
MLGVERLHVLIKTLSKGKKNLLVTLQRKYELFWQSQLQWKHDADHVWSNARKNLLNKQPVQEQKQHLILLGKQYRRVVSDQTFSWLQDQWAVRSKPYDRFKDSYNTYVRNCNLQKRFPVRFSKWNPFNRDPQTEEEKKKRNQQKLWQSMEKTVWEVERLTMDGVLFRTELLEKRKHNKTENSCIVGETYTYGRESAQRSRYPEKCYGRIQRFYLHFMYPPSPEEWQVATEDGRVDPNKVTTVPWAVFAECTWYEDKGIDPKTQLTQVQYNAAWTEQQCPLISMDNCYSWNVALWPSVPYNDAKYDDKGKLLPSQVDIQDYSTQLHNVITHHD